MIFYIEWIPVVCIIWGSLNKSLALSSCQY